MSPPVSTRLSARHRARRMFIEPSRARGGEALAYVTVVAADGAAQRAFAGRGGDVRSADMPVGQ